MVAVAVGGNWAHPCKVPGILDRKDHVVLQTACSTDQTAEAEGHGKPPPAADRLHNKGRILLLEEDKKTWGRKLELEVVEVVGNESYKTVLPLGTVALRIVLLERGCYSP